MPWLSISRTDDGGPEWRGSDWPVTDGLNGGRACPVCHATVHKGARWRAHALKEDRDAARFEAMDEQIRVLSRAVRILAAEAGHGDWYPNHAGEDQEEAPVGGYVIGSGPLPAETRGGGE